MKLMGHNANLMRAHGHHKQVLLFLITIVLPSSVLIMLTWHMIDQQRELSEKRLTDERRRMTAEIGQKLLVRLEEIKLREVSAVTSGIKTTNIIEYTSSEMILTGLANDEQLLLPWQVSQANNRLAPDKSSFFEKIQRAEEEEFVRKRFDQAKILYIECIKEAQQSSRQAYARLLLARVLMKLDEIDESIAEYRSILATSTDIADEYGVPFCLYAASNLLQIGDSYDEIIQIITSELDLRRWLSPIESYMLLDLADVLVELDSIPEIQKQEVGDLQQRILKYIEKQEQALALQRDFPKLVLMAQWGNPKQEDNPVWIPYGEKTWLVSLAPPLLANPRLVSAFIGKSETGYCCAKRNVT
jgi:tetratricopeptide (TPR) repeat protein